MDIFKRVWCDLTEHRFETEYVGKFAGGEITHKKCKRCGEEVAAWDILKNKE